MANKVIPFPEREPLEMCEGGCGPAEYEDADGIFLCQRCHEDCCEEGAKMTPAQRRAFALGLDVIEGGVE